MREKKTGKRELVRDVFEEGMCKAEGEGMEVRNRRDEKEIVRWRR